MIRLFLVCAGHHVAQFHLDWIQMEIPYQRSHFRDQKNNVFNFIHAQLNENLYECPKNETMRMRSGPEMKKMSGISNFLCRNVTSKASLN